MTNTGNEDHSITLAEATALTKKYRDENADQTLGHAIGKQAISDILAQAGCVGLRIYYALKTSGEKQLVFVGIDSNGDDLYNGLLADRTFNCPPDCGAANVLNS